MSALWPITRIKVVSSILPLELRRLLGFLCNHHDLKMFAYAPCVAADPSKLAEPLMMTLESEASKW